MALSTVNRSFEKTGRGDLYIAAHPASGSGTLTERIDAYFDLFYTDGTARTATPLTTPWGHLTADGFKVKVKANAIEVDPNNGPKHQIGIQDMEITFELGIYDMTPAKLAELASCSAEELMTPTGKSVVALGGQSNLTPYVLMYRMPSLVSGKFDHILIPRANFVIETDLDFNKKSALSCKIKGSALPEAYGMVNTAGFPEQLIYDIATA
jgi:hypothetical protein